MGVRADGERERGRHGLLQSGPCVCGTDCQVWCSSCWYCLLELACPPAGWWRQHDPEHSAQPQLCYFERVCERPHSHHHLDPPVCPLGNCRCPSSVVDDPDATRG